jgi:hypothetical protein
MMAAGNFFEEGFPKELFHKLLWLEAEEETENWERKVHFQNMSL